MDLFHLFALLTTLAAVFSWLNHRTLRLPTTIGLMLIALLFSLGLIALGALGIGLERDAERLLEAIDFDDTLLHGMLGALLFAGALHVNLNDLASQKRVITLLASVGVVSSTLIVGSGAWWIFTALGFEIALLPCLLFGALISPTDPVAVLGVLKRVAVPKTLETKIAGESLFNDGVAVVVFLVLLGLTTGEQPASAGGIARLLLQEVLGGLAFGLAIGWLAYRMLSTVDQYEVEILITLAIVTGGYAAAQRLHVSGPLAMVVAGLLIGNHGRSFAMSERTRERLDSFWELVDELMNALLFMLIGFELLVVRFDGRFLLAGLLMIPLVLGARFVSVGVPVTLLRHWRRFTPHAVKILVWGGLRGGISVALALSLPPSPERELLVTATYIVVAFSIIVQGLSLERVVTRLQKTADAG